MAADYLTPTRSQYWRDTAAYRAPAFAGSRVASAGGVRASTPVSSYRTTTSAYASRYDTRPAAATRDSYAAYESPPLSTVPRAQPAYGGRPSSYEDYSTPPRRTATPAACDRDASDWRPDLNGPPSSGLPRGRGDAPRSPGYTYLPAHRMEVAASSPSSLAPPRPHMQRAAGGVVADGGSAMGRWSPSGTYASPYRGGGVVRDDSPAAAVRAPSPPPHTMTATHFASPSTPRGTPRGAVSGIHRSPSMVKDPCSSFIPAAHPNASHRLCLALDLDETLVYARNGPVHVRPFAKELLRELHDMDVEVIVWTAGERDYAQSVIRMLDPHGTIQHCVYRHSKWWTGQPGYTKNLRSLGRNMSRTLLVDNTPDCLRDHPENGLLVSDFEGPRSGYDQCLRDLVHVVAEIVARPHDPVPRVMAESRYIARRTVPMDAGGTITTWTLSNDRVLEETSYQAARYNRDSPPRTTRARGW